VTVVDGSFLAFVGVSLLVIVTPGPDTALTIRNTLRGGRAGGVFTGLGVASGQLIWATATSAGLATVLLASEPVFRAVKLAGAVYLVILGVRSLLAALRAERPASGSARDVRPRLGSGAAFRQGVVNNLGNPKMAVFFASVLPQFAPEGHGIFSALVGFGAVFSALTLAWLASYAVVISAVGGLWRGSSLSRALEGLAGAVLIGLGARMAADAR
jgi:threonine/homoserine/homoserine lactone efflux protein